MISDAASVTLVGFFGVVITAMCKAIPRRMNGDCVRKEIYEQRAKMVDEKHQDVAKAIDKLFNLAEENNKTIQTIAQDVAILVDRRDKQRK